MSTKIKMSLCTVLVGMQIGISIMDNSMVVFQKQKNNRNKAAIIDSNPTFGYVSEANEIRVIATLFAIAKIRKKPKCPSSDEWLEM